MLINAHASAVRRLPWRQRETQMRVKTHGQITGEQDLAIKLKTKLASFRARPTSSKLERGFDSSHPFLRQPQQARRAGINPARFIPLVYLQCLDLRTRPSSANIWSVEPRVAGERAIVQPPRKWHNVLVSTVALVLWHDKGIINMPAVR